MKYPPNVEFEQYHRGVFLWLEKVMRHFGADIIEEVKGKPTGYSANISDLKISMLLSSFLKDIMRSNASLILKYFLSYKTR